MSPRPFLYQSADCSITAARKSTLIFCVNLRHLRDLTNMFRDAGVDARYVYSGTPPAERQALVQSFKEEKFPILLNVGELPFICTVKASELNGSCHI